MRCLPSRQRHSPPLWPQSLNSPLPSPVSPFASLSFPAFLSIVHTLWQTQAPNHNLDKFQLDLVSKANAPLPAGTQALGSGPALGSVMGWESATHSAGGWLQFQLLLGSGGS